MIVNVQEEAAAIVKRVSALEQLGASMLHERAQGEHYDIYLELKELQEDAKQAQECLVRMLDGRDSCEFKPKPSSS